MELTNKKLILNGLAIVILSISIAFLKSNHYHFAGVLLSSAIMLWISAWRLNNNMTWTTQSTILRGKNE